jgi:transcription elongation GreA/GreB family factor
MNKREVVERIIEQLREGLEVYEKAARAAHAEATHEQSKAENKYDTRGLEASYLARGQSRHAAEIVHAIEEFSELRNAPAEFSEGIDVGALVELSGRRDRSFYFFGPRAGGTEVVVDGQEVLVLTPQSPLGQQLVGRKAGENVKLAIAGTTTEFKIASVS